LPPATACGLQRGFPQIGLVNTGGNHRVFLNKEQKI
jgi:hypothetical protein